MRKLKFGIIVLAVVSAVLAIFFVLRSKYALVTHPKGIIAHSELALIKKNILLMLIVVVPTFVLLCVTAWKYRATNTHVKRDLETPLKRSHEVILWVIPSIIVLVMAIVTWYATHELDPYQPIKSDVRPLKIQVVAMDWKWLFIYPEEGIASVNFVQFPAGVPIHFTLAADDSPMNSFWIPELSGQIYAMAGMVTPLHLMADAPGEYAGRAAEINGEGFADMTFVAKSTTQSEFDAWVAAAKQSPLQLNESAYASLLKRSVNHPKALYSFVENELFDKIVMKYMHPAH